MKEVKTKVCTKCKVEKRFEDFSIENSRKDKRHLWCKRCSKIYNREKYASKYAEKNKNFIPEVYPTDTLKTCYKCKEEKFITEFPKNKLGKFAVKSVCRVCDRVRVSTWKKNNPDRVRNLHLKYKHNISLDIFNEMLKHQNNCCAICKIDAKDILGKFKQKLVVDHCHTTGKVRALLCDSCNVGLGLFKDNIESLRKSADYLEFYKDRNLVITLN
jgi:hypothetical protein